MAASSEDALLIVDHVRNKKTDGTLYMMGERLGWMQGSKSTFSISYFYADIKAQKISPDSKEKVQLQLVLHDGSANTFHFNNPHGREESIKNREGVKELLQQLLPRFRRKLNSELEEKNRMLQENPELFQLYKDLVVSGVITAEEFWASRKASSNVKPETKHQPVGVSAAFLADIKPQTDGCNGLKYNLTADIIESIFRTYPMVKMKHSELVPHQMTESEFWTRFFQSHYFHRDRTNISSKDVFSECAKNDEKEMKDEIDTNINDPLLDLTKISDSTLDDGYGVSSADRKNSNNQTNLTMIRRFNHHSTMVLKACQKDDGAQAMENGPTDAEGSQTLVNGDVNYKSSKHNHEKDVKSSKTNGHMNHKVKHSDPRPSTSAEGIEPHVKRKKIKEKIHYDDLVMSEDRGSVNLTLHKMEGYLHGPTPVKAMKYTSSEDVLKARDEVTEEIQSWSPNLSMVLGGTTAIQVLGELSPGGALMKGTSHQQLNQMIPSEVQDAVKAQYNALLELLRHFWSCFPVSSKFLEEKVVKMKSTLEKFQMAKLNPLRDQLEREHYTMNLTGHMEEMLSAAYRKYDTWQSRKMSSRR